MIKEGDRVQINAFSHKGQKGYVRFKGEVDGLMGEMLGIELDEPKGKNDGTHGDTRYFTCEENYGIFFRSAQVKAIADEASTPRSSVKGSTLKKPATGLKKPAGSGLKKPTKAAADEEDKSEKSEEPRSSTKVKTGLKGPASRASGIKKPAAGDSATDKANKISKVKAGSRLAAPKLGLKKTDSTQKKPEGTKSIAQKKEEIRNKVKAKRQGIPGTKATASKAGGDDDSRKSGVKKFARPKKPSEIQPKAVKKPSQSQKSEAQSTPRTGDKVVDDIDDAEEAKLEASMISTSTNESKKTGAKLKTPAMKKPGSTSTAKSGIGGKGVSKLGAGKKLGLKKPGGAATKEPAKKPVAKAPAAKATKAPIKEKPIEEEKPVGVDDDDGDDNDDNDNDEVEDITPPALSDEEDEDFSKKTEQEDQDSQQKKVFKRKTEGSIGDTGTGSNFKMLQQAKVELAKKDTEIAKMQEELKELCKYYISHIS